MATNYGKHFVPSFTPQQESIYGKSIGDATCDKAPVQIGQFECGIELETQLTEMYLEGGGGGQKTESYELALYFLARKTKCANFEKRSKKGYAFIIGDETAYPVVKRREVSEWFGDTIQEDIPISQIVEEVKQKWELFFILPNLTAHYSDREVWSFWTSLLGQNAIKLEDPNGISELIASTIGLSEGAVDMSSLTKDISDVSGKDTADAVSRALVAVGDSKKDLALTKGTGLATL